MVNHMRHTKGHRDQRRANFALKAGSFSKCSHCGTEKLPHIVCANCGYYGDRQVIDVMKKMDKKERKKKEKELAGEPGSKEAKA